MMRTDRNKHYRNTLKKLGKRYSNIIYYDIETLDRAMLIGRTGVGKFKIFNFDDVKLSPKEVFDTNFPIVYASDDGKILVYDSIL